MKNKVLSGAYACTMWPDGCAVIRSEHAAEDQFHNARSQTENSITCLPLRCCRRWQEDDSRQTEKTSVRKFLRTFQKKNSSRLTGQLIQTRWKPRGVIHYGPQAAAWCAYPSPSVSVTSRETWTVELDQMFWFGGIILKSYAELFKFSCTSFRNPSAKVCKEVMSHQPHFFLDQHGHLFFKKDP
jgi:hypothetical protein